VGGRDARDQRAREEALEAERMVAEGRRVTGHVASSHRGRSQADATVVAPRRRSPRMSPPQETSPDPDGVRDATRGATPSEPHPTRFVFIDTEATGLDLARHDLTEVAWIVRREDGTEDERHYFPEHTLDGADEKALELTHYHERIAEQPRTPMDVWLPQFLEDADGAVLVGAVPDFDARQMAKACRKLGVEPTWDHHLLDVETLALPLIAPGPEAPRSLAKTCEALGVEHDEDEAHGALYDARQARAVFDAVWALVADVRASGGPLPPPVRRPVKDEQEAEDDDTTGDEPAAGVEEAAVSRGR
jgi:DNA polymerase III epsilon subunit-like protein